MKLKLLNNYFLIVFITGFLSCKVNDEKPIEFPQITSEGKGTFGCRINGEIFIPSGFKGRLQKEYYTWNLSHDLYGTFVLIAYRSGDGGQLESFRVSHPKIFNIGTYYILPKKEIVDTSGYGGFQYKNSFYSLNTGKGLGKINISRYDTFARIISGTFDFWTCNTTNANDTAFVTDGRFDVKY